MSALDDQIKLLRQSGFVLWTPPKGMPAGYVVFKDLDTGLFFWADGSADESVMNRCRSIVRAHAIQHAWAKVSRSNSKT